jgi:NAD+ diphosphatase
MHYLYCPTCGAKLIDHPAGDDGMVPYCERCGVYYFDGFPTAVLTMVVNDKNEICMELQKYLSDKYWNFVSGYVTPGETAEEAARREVKEEVGIDLDSLCYVSSYWYEPKGILMLGFIGKTKQSKIVPSKEVNKAEWIPCQDARPLFFPEGSGNLQYPLYQAFLKELGQK